MKNCMKKINLLILQSQNAVLVLNILILSIIKLDSICFCTSFQQDGTICNVLWFIRSLNTQQGGFLLAVVKILQARSPRSSSIRSLRSWLRMLPKIALSLFLFTILFKILLWLMLLSISIDCSYSILLLLHAWWS